MVYAHPKGTPKTPGSGRKKGTKNKATLRRCDAVAEALNAINSFPGAFKEGSVDFLRAVYKHPLLDLNLRTKCAIALAQYEAPRLQTISHTGPNGGPIKIEDVNVLETARQVAFLLAKAIALQKAKVGPMLEHSDCSAAMPPVDLAQVPAMLVESAGVPADGQHRDIAEFQFRVKE